MVKKQTRKKSSNPSRRPSSDASRRRARGQRSAPAAKRRSNRASGSAKRASSKRSWATFWWRWVFKIGLVLSVVAVCAVVYLDAKVRYTYSAKKWAVPARVYGRPLEMYAGMALGPAAFEQEVRQLGYRFVTRAQRPGEVSRQGSNYSIYTRGFTFWDGAESPTSAQLTFGSEALKSLQSASGSALVRLEPAQIGSIYPAHNEDRILVRVEDVPPSLLEMLVVMEDRGFYEHHGVEPLAIARAAVANVRAGRTVQGGSTLTQQLVKNYYLDARRSLSRKMVEAVMAISLDLHYSKEAILEGYINEIFLGQDGPRAIHGFGLASQYYFNQPIEHLKLHQLAFLVALVRGASFYDPWRHPQRALDRRNLVLATMYEQGYIDLAEAKKAELEPLGVGQRDASYRHRYPAYLDLVRRQLKRDYDAEDLSSEGLVIFTNLDPTIQQGAEQALDNAIGQLQQRYSDLGEMQGAVVISQPETGSVLAVVGGREARFAGFNRALDALRPIGSLVKPAVYLTALASDQFTLASLLPDEPLRVELPNGDHWAPRNYDRKSHGPTPLFVALAKSYNQATAWLGMEVGVDEVVDTLGALGVQRELMPVPSLLLGSAELNVLEVAQTYQTIASEGFYTPLRAIRAVTSGEGDRLSQYSIRVDQRVDRDAVFQLQAAMQETAAWGTGRVVRRYLADDFHVAVKTGTSDGQRDSWFAGFSGDLLGVVWLGRDDNSVTPLTGSSGAGLVWGEIFQHYSRQPLLGRAGVDFELAEIDPTTGLLGRSCEGARLLPFLVGTSPTDKAPCYREPRWIDRVFR
jgi:penicillin-binding protein 1B